MKEKLLDQSLDKTIFRAVFDIVSKVSTNKIYAGLNWRTRVRHKDQYQWEVMRVIKENNLQPIDGFPIVLRFKFFFKKRVLDSSNCSYMAKLIEDCLVCQNIIPDDSIQYVSEVQILAVKGRKDEVLLEALNHEHK